MSGQPLRIVVALDSSAHARAAMEAAADLAERLRAEILALFVEDAELARLAALPFATEIGSDATARPFDLPRVERHFRSHVREARATCERTAERRRVVARFEVVRGSVSGEILAAAEGAEMVILGRASARGIRLGRTTQAVLARSTRPVAVVTAERAFGRPVAVVFDGSAESRRALDLAIRLAGEDHRNLAVLIPFDGPRRDEVAAEARAIAAPAGITPRCIGVAATARAIRRSVEERGCRVLVLDRASALLEDGGIVAMVEQLDCPVFVTG